MKTMRDPLSTFLHSKAWANHWSARFDDGENTWAKKSLPKDHYWLSTRTFIDESWQLPEFCTDGMFIRIQPDSENSDLMLKKAITKQQVREVAAVQPRETLWIDLTQSEETLLANMKSKHRYNIRVAERHDINVTIESHDLLTHWPRMWKLLQNTSERQEFGTHTNEYYQSIIRNLEPENMVHLVFAQNNEGVDCAAAMIVTNNHVGTYLHGASDYDHRQLMAPFLLHWKVMTWLKGHGHEKYDFWGIHSKDGEAIPNHPSYGTSRFKLGFGGNILHYPPTYDIILKPFWYSLYNLYQKLRMRKRAFS